MVANADGGILAAADIRGQALFGKRRDLLRGCILGAANKGIAAEVAKASAMA